MRDRQRGITLIDMLIATVIVVILVGVAYPGFKVANDTMTTSGVRDRIERTGDRTLKVLVKEIRIGKVVQIQDDPPLIEVQRPQTGIDLNSVSTDGNVPWKSGSVLLRFREMRTVSESATGHDVNGDGDRSDSFALGVLERVENGVARPVTDRAQVILGLPGYTADVDGDGMDDPLFDQQARIVRIEIHLVQRDEKGRFLRTTVRGGVHLRNIQK